MGNLAWLNPEKPVFPAVDQALKEPDGLLAVGGNLHPETLLAAYRQGIFPWYEDGQPILWWAPDPRAILFPGNLIIRRSLRKRLRHSGLRVALDQDFDAVIEACAGPRRGQPGTWITAAIRMAYGRMYQLGHGHCVSVYDADGRLVGGLYGLALGQVFFGESMFSRVPDASKIALAVLVAQLIRWDFKIIDCQQSSRHLMSLGATEISRQAFTRQLAQASQPVTPKKWILDPDLSEFPNRIIETVQSAR